MLFFGGLANAALLSRLSGQAYYDTELNITWLADANYAKTSGYDSDGLMSWSAAHGWIASLNAANHLGVNTWRLPFVVDTGATGCVATAYSGTDCGYNVQTKTGATVYSEMAHLYYTTLGNTGAKNTSGFDTGGACLIGPNYCLTNSGPFSNIQPNYYWSGTENAGAINNAWVFYFGSGLQTHSLKFNGFYAWAVSPGDIAAVPVPGAAGLFGAALAALWVMGQRARTSLV